MCDLQLINVRGDGTCFYHAVQQLLTGKVDDGFSLRRTFGAFLEENEILFREHPLIIGDKNTYVLLVTA